MREKPVKLRLEDLPPFLLYSNQVRRCGKYRIISLISSQSQKTRGIAQGTVNDVGMGFGGEGILNDHGDLLLKNVSNGIKSQPNEICL